MALSSETVFILDLLAYLAPYLVVALSLNLEYGFGGIPNFGKAFAVMGGAFTVGYLPGRLAVTMLGLGNGFGEDYIKRNAMYISQVNQVLASNPMLATSILLLSLVAAMAVGAVLGAVLYYPLAKLREEFLAMVLLAIGELLVLFGRNYPPLVGGTLGVSVPDVFRWAGENRYLVTTAFMSAVALLVLAFVEALTRSPLGRLLRAVRDDESAAYAYGKDVAKVRLEAFIVSSSIGALAGALYAFYTTCVVSSPFARVVWTFWPWVMVILGGTANNMGVLLGVFTFVSVKRLIIRYKYVLEPVLPFSVIWLDMLLLGVALVLILLYRPEGLLPERPIKTVGVKRTVKRLGVR
ncbi:MAG: branched-chain amino acid ABC transporter permease, partial [Thermoplasmata archaeon]